MTTQPAIRNTRAAEKLRSAMLSAVSDQDIADVTQKLIALAKGGDVSAAKLLFDRCMGKPTVPQQTPTIAVQQNVQLSQPGDGRRLAQAVVARIRAERQAR